MKTTQSYCTPQTYTCRPLSATQAIEQQTHAELSGRWQKDKSQSDSMQKACDVVQLKWVLRRALAVLNTLEVWAHAVFSHAKQCLRTIAVSTQCVGHMQVVCFKIQLKSESFKSNSFLYRRPWLSSNSCKSKQAQLSHGFLQIEDTPDYLRTVIKAGGIMDVVEQYPWNGQERQHSRRDKRGGHHHGKVVRTERGPAIR